MHVPKGVLWFIFNLQKKIRLIIHTTNYTSYILRLFVSLISDRIFILYILELVSTAANESILASMPKQTNSYLPQPRDLGCFLRLPTPMNCLGYPLLGLPRPCCRSKSQTQALINHTNTHHKLRQHSNITVPN
jgi:hypothetical protein